MMRLVIFDCDQTLLDTIHRFHEVFNMTCRIFGIIPLSWDDFIRLYSADRLIEYIPASLRSAFWRRFLELYTFVRHPRDRAIPGARDALRFFKSIGLKIVVVTGRICRPDELEDELQEHGLLDYVDLVLTNVAPAATLIDKTRQLRIALARMRAPPAEAAHVSDYMPDVAAARKLGMLAIGVLTGYMAREKLLRAGAHLVIGSVAELPKIWERGVLRGI